MAMHKLVQTTFGATGSSATLSSPSGKDYKMFTISISGTFDATIALRRSLDDGATWHTIESYTEVTEKNVEVISDFWVYKLECTVFGSGSAVTAFAK
jgi:hypothetical protein